MPSKAAGIRPKSVNAEYRPPTNSSAEKIFLKLCFLASASSDVPGSVVAIKCEPSFLLNFQKYLNADNVSAVPPDLLATTYKLLSGGNLSAASATSTGSVESRIPTASEAFVPLAESRELKTSAVSDEPPIPKTKTRSIFAS